MRHSPPKMAGNSEVFQMFAVLLIPDLTPLYFLRLVKDPVFFRGMMFLANFDIASEAGILYFQTVARFKIKF